MNKKDEILDIVNEHDEVIDKQPRSVIYQQKSKNFRVINGFIKNSAGQLWIPRRSASKRIFPSCLDVSVGGHVECGENYEQAFKRELHEELNLHADQITYKKVTYLTPYKHDVSAFMQVYEISIDEIPNYNKNDFIEYFWLYPHEVLQKLAEGDKAKDDLSKIIKILYK